MSAYIYQTLNEKIEERNETLHKLQKENIKTVQILTHTKEKLEHVRKKNEDKKRDADHHANELHNTQKDLHQLKQERDKQHATNEKLKQKTQ